MVKEKIIEKDIIKEEVKKEAEIITTISPKE
jgi:hypothetical protein